MSLFCAITEKGSGVSWFGSEAEQPSSVFGVVELRVDFIRNRFIGNQVLDALKFKRRLELQAMS